MSGSKTLPPKEKGQFNHVITLYETKQLRKAQKVADSILKKFPDHGETLAMKGLVLNALNRKEEAYTLVRSGLAKDMRSYVSWHVYGLLYRSDRLYTDAAKAYLNALRIHPKNVQILRDLALLQIQLRDYDAFCESRRKLLMLAPSKKTNWLAFSLSCHLLGNYDTSLKILETFNSTQSEKDREVENKHEVSELLMYEAMVLEESKDFDGALKHLEKSAKDIVDRLGLMEMRVRLYTLLGKHDEAAEELKRLIAINPDNYEYQRNLYTAIEASNSGVTPLQMCDQLAEQYPRAQAARRLALDLCPAGESFAARIHSYVESYLRRGVPSLFSDLKQLYNDPEKAALLGKVFESYEQNTEAARGKATTLEVDLERLEKLRKAPGSLLWVKFYLAQHYDRLGDFDKALQFIDSAIAYTPTVVECYQIRGRIFKHAGALQKAAECLDEARKMDLADRYMNTKCVKYFLRAGRLTEAEDLVYLFTRDGNKGGIQALYEMQASWYELESADTFLRAGDLSKALKRYRAIRRHYDDMVEDQFDFHTYCLRKVTLRSYVDMLRMEDRIRQQGAYIDASHGIFQCMMKLSEIPLEEREIEGITTEEALAMKTMSPAEKKKQVRKIKKRTARKAVLSLANGKQGLRGAKSSKNGVDKKEVDGDEGKTRTMANGNAKKKEKSDNKNKGKVSKGWMEEDPDGMEYMKTVKDPLMEAWSVALEMEKYTPESVKTWNCVLTISIKRKKWLKSVKAVKRLHGLSPRGASTTLGIAKLLVFLNPIRSTLSTPIEKVLTRELDPLIEKQGISETLRVLNPDPFVLAQANLWISLHTKKESIPQCVTTLVSTIEMMGNADVKSINVRQATQILQMLSEAGLDYSSLDKVKRSFHQVWPIAEAFVCLEANGTKNSL